MRIMTAAAVLAAYLAASPLGAQTPPAPNENNCRAAISQGLEMLRRTPPGATARDEEDRKRLLDEMQRLVEESRHQGMTECQTWTRMMGKAFNQ
jgi:hypothetical protein